MSKLSGHGDRIKRKKKSQFVGGSGVSENTPRLATAPLDYIHGPTILYPWVGVMLDGVVVRSENSKQVLVE